MTLSTSASSNLAAISSRMHPVSCDENNICRLCIKKEGTVPIFNDDGHLRVVGFQIMTITKLKVSFMDGLPTHICSECMNMVHSFFSFKVQCEASDETLRAMSVMKPITEQDLAATSNSEISAVSNRLHDTRYRLDETHDRLNTLVTSLEGIQQKYCDDGCTSTVSGKRARKGMKKTVTFASPGPCELVDIADEAEEPKVVVEVPEVPLGFKGFTVEECDSGHSEVQGVDPQPSGSSVSLPNESCCYLVELTSESEWDVNCGSAARAWTLEG